MSLATRLRRRGAVPARVLPGVRHPGTPSHRLAVHAGGVGLEPAHLVHAAAGAPLAATAGAWDVLSKAGRR